MIGEVDEYFYHGDHISSVVLVTDKKAKVVQQFAYMPLGELLVDNSTVDLDFRFSAKETDRESGLGYFGARYYDNTSAMWLGVDPLWEKYAGMNPYNYCAGNPVMLVDRDGRREEKINLGGPCKKAPHGKVAKSPSKEKFSYNKLYPEFNPNKPIGIITFNVNNPQAKPKELNSILDAHMEIIGGYCLQNEYTKNNLISYLDEVFANMGGLQDIDIVTIHFYEDNKEDVKNRQLFLESVMIEIGLSENQFLITGEQGNNDESDILSVGIFKQSDFKKK